MTPPCWLGVRARRVTPPLAPTFVSLDWLQASSLHQTPIEDLDRSVDSTPCPRNTSVPSLVQSKSSWLFVQLAPGSREGQSSSEERPSAPHECSEGRWVSNQGEWIPGTVQEAIACFAALATITDLRISCRPRDAGFALGSSIGFSLNLAPVRRLDHLPPLHQLLRARKRSMSKARSLLSIR